jgi:Protein of unknown function (DUF998)
LQATTDRKKMTDKAKGKVIMQTNALLICGAIACPLFIITVLIEGAARPDYNSFLYPLSSLSIGDNGWTQISNFIITGILVVLFSRGVRQVFGSPKVKQTNSAKTVHMAWTCT